MAYNSTSIKPYIKSHLELQREITLIKLAPSPYFFVLSICLAYLNMFARFDENPAMNLQDIKETKRYGRTERRTDRQRENSIPPFFAHPINLKGLVVSYIFRRLIHIFKDDFTKFHENSRPKDTFFKFKEFFRTKVKIQVLFQVCANPEPNLLHKAQYHAVNIDLCIYQ